MCYRTYRTLMENGFRLHRIHDFIRGEKREFVCESQQEMGLLSVVTDVKSRKKQRAKPSSSRAGVLLNPWPRRGWECWDLGMPQPGKPSTRSCLTWLCLTWLSPCPGGAEILTWCCRGKGSSTGLDQHSFTWPLSASSRCSFTGASGFTAHKLINN